MGHHAPMQLPGPGWRVPFWPSATGPGPAPPTEHRTSAARPPSCSPLATSQAAAQPLVPGRCGLLGRPAPAPWGTELAKGRFALHAEHVAWQQHAACPPPRPAALRRRGQAGERPAPALSRPGGRPLSGGLSHKPFARPSSASLGRQITFLLFGPHPSPAWALLIGVITPVWFP